MRQWPCLLFLTPLLSAVCEAKPRKCPQGRRSSECFQQALVEHAVQFDTPNCLKIKRPPKDFEAFFSEVYSSGQPVIIDNAWDIFGDVNRWSNLTYLKKQSGKTKFRVSLFNAAQDRPGQGMTTSAGDGVDRFGVTPVDGGSRVWMPRSELQTMEDVLENGNPARMSFAEEYKLFIDGRVVVPKLFDEWRKPTFLEPLKYEEVNIWAGRLLSKRPKESPLHHDPFENVMLQLAGSKTFVMVTATESANVYPRWMLKRHAPPPGDLKSQGLDADRQSSVDNFSPVDPERPDLDRFPQFKKAHVMRCSLDPGQALFMPAYTWHNVLSYGDPDSKVNLGVNAWFAPQPAMASLMSSLLEAMTGRIEDAMPRSERNEL
eukprot:TRINITY_DN68296_c0_g1_i1.p1 TRINITY_DN68296_c0_g1~~TRINITY_DN68296_c0_g1_i1.p1  ORF type:complete len:374 (-),score=46.21 TRINITY_DN68296_c0_g1_i1:71-1192(-)